MNLTSHGVTCHDGSPGWCTYTPTIHNGRTLPGHYDVRVRPTSPFPMTPTPAAGPSGSHNAHAKLSPSGSKCWTTCTAAPSFLEANAHRIPKDNSSAYSIEGTEAHDWAADVLLNKIAIEQVPADVFREPVAAYVAHCLALVPENVSYQVEVVAPLWYAPGSTGTCDFAIVTDDLVVIRDLKFGMGVLVHGHENSQLAIYCYSLIKMLDDVYPFTPDTVVNLGVFQPRHREAQDAQPWVITLGELEKFCLEIEYKAIQCNVGLERVRAKLPCGERDISAAEILEAAPLLKFIPEDGDEGSCRWCRTKAICEIRRGATTDAIGFDQVISGADLIALMPDLDKAEAKMPVEDRVGHYIASAVDGSYGIVTDEYLVKISGRKKAIIKFLEDVEEYLEARVLGGEKIDGLKLVEGRMGNRAWNSEDAADSFLKNQGMKQDERYSFKLKSPTQIEELLKEKLKKSTRTRNLFAGLVSRSSPQKTLALASDKREAVVATIDMMPDLGAEEEEFDI